MSLMRLRVNSSRLLELEAATPRTVAEVREMLAKDGLDVKDADISVLSARHRAPVVGNIGEYVIGDKDIVSFDTVEVFAPVAEQQVKEHIARALSAAICSCGHSCGCTKQPRVWLA